MTPMQSIQDFTAQRKLAVVGASRSGKKFGNLAYRTLKAQGYKLFAVHPEATSIEGDPCVKKLSELPEAVDGVFVCVPPAQAERIVGEAASAGIKRIWFQQGSESAAAIRACSERGLAEVHGQCLLMFTKPSAWYHRAHRWVWKISGKLPA